MGRDPLTERIIGYAIEVHRHLGPGLLENAYHQCLILELSRAGIPFESEKQLPVKYKGLNIDCNYRLDVVVANQLILELKAVDKISDLHKAQLLTYLKLSGIRKGLLINFNETVLFKGIVRMVH